MKSERSLISRFGYTTFIVTFLLSMMIFLLYFFNFSTLTNFSTMDKKLKKPKVFKESPVTLNITQRFICEVNKRLGDLYNKLEKQNAQYYTLKEIRTLLKLYPCNNSKVPEAKSTVELVDVCPDKYMGQKYGESKFYLSGFNMENCTNAKPFYKVVTIVLNAVLCFPHCTGNLIKILHGIEMLYVNLTVVLGLPPKTVWNSTNVKSIDIKVFNLLTESSLGYTWNSLIQHVKTPYAFIGYDIMDFTWYAQLPRQIRALSQSGDIAVTGSSLRTPDSFWDANCYQQTLENYVLKYQLGYYHSVYECMFCHFINGPFMARVNILKENKLNYTMPESVLFMDLFLRLKAKGYSVLSCPDAMNFVKGSYFNGNHSDLLQIAQKYIINVIHFPNNRTERFSCNETNQSCSILYLTKYYLMPPCCREKIVEAVNIVHNFFEAHNLTYVIMDGTLLGSVKVYGVMPWDVDVDIFYDAKDYSKIKSEKAFWEKNGFKTEFWPWNTIPTTTGYLIEGRIRLYFSDMYIELISKFNGSKFHDDGFTKTKMKFDTIYVYGPTSPGLAARNMYGINCLRHAQSYIVLGIKSWTDYSMAGTFLECPKEYHACLDKFPADGNIDYIVR